MTVAASDYRRPLFGGRRTHGPASTDPLWRIQLTGSALGERLGSLVEVAGSVASIESAPRIRSISDLGARTEQRSKSSPWRRVTIPQ